MSHEVVNALQMHEGFYFTRDGRERPAVIAIVFNDIRLVVDAETGDNVTNDHDGAYMIAAD